jgi:hypothetical protein
MSCSGTQPGVVRLNSSRRDEGIASLGKRFTQQELKLAQLVATATYPHQVVSLNKQPDIADLALQPLESLDRGRSIEQR